MNKTENLGLNRPAQTDFYNVEDFNENADIIDRELADRLSCSKGGVVNGVIYIGTDEETGGSLKEQGGELIIESSGYVRVSDLACGNIYFKNKNGYKDVHIKDIYEPRGNCVCVAAYNSTEAAKKRADYVSGSALGDRMAIMDAIAACAEGGVVELLEGEFVISSDGASSATEGVVIRKALTIRGAGKKATVAAQEGEVGGDPAILFSIRAEGVCIENMTLSMRPETNGTSNQLIEVCCSGAEIRDCVFESEENLRLAAAAIYFVDREGVTPADGIKGARIEGCGFNIDYSSAENTVSDDMCDIMSDLGVKLGARIYGNTSKSGTIVFNRNFDDLDCGGELVIFGNGNIKQGGNSGTSVKSYGM